MKQCHNILHTDLSQLSSAIILSKAKKQINKKHQQDGSSTFQIKNKLQMVKGKTKQLFVG